MRPLHSRSPMRHLYRLTLRRRAKRVRIARQFQELDKFLADVRAERANQPPWERRVYADEADC